MREVFRNKPLKVTLFRAIRVSLKYNKIKYYNYEYDRSLNFNK